MNLKLNYKTFFRNFLNECFHSKIRSPAELVLNLCWTLAELFFTCIFRHIHLLKFSCIRRKMLRNVNVRYWRTWRLWKVHVSQPFCNRLFQFNFDLIAVAIKLKYWEKQHKMVHLIVEHLLSTSGNRLLYESLWNLAASKSYKNGNSRTFDDQNISEIW